jgi:hypothetical protein
MVSLSSARSSASSMSADSAFALEFEEYRSVDS